MPPVVVRIGSRHRVAAAIGIMVDRIRHEWPLDTSKKLDGFSDSAQNGFPRVGRNILSNELKTRADLRELTRRCWALSTPPSRCVIDHLYNLKMKIIFNNATSRCSGNGHAMQVDQKGRAVGIRRRVSVLPDPLHDP